MNDAAREMTLAEWVDRLPPNHSARKEYAALREQPEARGVVDARWQHAANEWADIATNAVVWLRNVRDGIATFDAAIADMERGYAHCRAQQPALTAAQQPGQEGGGEVCPRCKGAGEYEGFARHASGDPQDEYAATVQCEPCEGTGEVAAPPSAPVGVERGAWTDDDMLKPWGAESAFLRHLASDPALNLEQSAMLRHCAKRIESTAGIHLRALADMLDPAKQAGVLRDAADALAQQPAPPSAPVGVGGLPQPFGYVEPRHDLSGYEVFDEPGPRRAAIWNMHGMRKALAQTRAHYSIDADPDGIRERVADAITGALAFGAQGTHKPSAGHWLEPFWDMARADAAPPSAPVGVEACGEDAAPEPFAWFAFADQNGPVPLGIYGWDRKACLYAVLMLARSEGWTGTVNGYLFHKGWSVRPVYTAPPPSAPVEQAHDLRALAQQPAQAAPGWKLVPMVATPEMLEAATGLFKSVGLYGCYNAMLAAAPTPPGDDAAGGGS